MLEDEIKTLANHLRSTPTLPPFEDALANVNAGAMWPSVFCAFQDCQWMLERGTETDIYEHILAEHSEEVAGATGLIQSLNPVDAVRSVYNAAIAHKVRQDAPLAGCSLDRTALRNFSEATAGDNVEALMCFSCACIHTCVKDNDGPRPIDWHKPVTKDPRTKEYKFLGASLPGHCEPHWP